MDATSELKQHVEKYKKNRDIMVEGFTQSGFDQFIVPEAGFYLYAHIEYWNKDALEFCEQMVQDIQVTASPGSDFDPINGHHYVRFSFAGSTDSIKEAVSRISEWRHLMR